MTLQIAGGIFFGFLFLAIFAGVLLGIAYIVGSRQDVPNYLKEPKQKRSIKDWWHDDEEEDDYP